MDDRKQYIGASDIAAILGVSPYKTAYQLWEEKTGRRVPVDISGEFHVQRGHDIEAELRMKIEAQYGLDCQTGHVWQDDAYSFLRCRDDGHDEKNNVLLECKYMKDEYVSEKTIPEYYQAQVQYELMLSKASKCIFAAKSEKNEMQVDVLPDEVMMKELKKAAITFWTKHVVTDTPPELTDQDTVDLGGNEELADLLSEYEAFDLAAKDFELKKADVKAKISEKTKDIARAKCTSYLMYRSSRAGNVSYAKIPELKGVDLEQYRGKPSSVFTIKKVKES